MRVLRGRLEDPTADRDRTSAMLERVVETDEPALRVWQPPEQLSFGRRDARASGYQAARKIAANHGFPPQERRAGGRAAAYTGATISFALATPIDDVRSGLGDRYETATMAVQRALWRLAVPAQRGEPADTFCPGNHSLSWRGKIAGLAQRVQRGVALVGGIVVVDGHDAIAEVLEPVYAALELPFDAESVGSIERAGGRGDHDAAVTTLRDSLAGDRSVHLESVEG
jgi:lipoate-protein ligase A